MEAGRYKIRDETAGRGGILTAKEWNNRIKPGMTVSMAMVLRKQVLANKTEHNCPACNSPYTGPKSNDLERVQWLVDVLSRVIKYATANFVWTREARNAQRFFKFLRNHEL